MDKKVIATTNAPGAIGPYSQAWAVGDFVFASGQIPVNPATGEIPAGIAAQTEQSCKNVAASMEAAGVTMDNVVKTTCYLKNMEDFSLFNEIYAQYFGDHKPARSCFAVARLPKDGLVEIEVIAAK